MASLSKELNRGGVPAPATKPPFEERRGAGLFPAHPAPRGATGATGAGLKGGGSGRSAGHGKDREQLLNPAAAASLAGGPSARGDRKSTRLNSSHVRISYAVFCLKKKTKTTT